MSTTQQQPTTTTIATTNNIVTSSTSPPDTLADRLAYVEALVDMNALVLEAIWPNSSNSDIVPLRPFIHQVLKRSRTTYSTLQTAFFYLFRARPAILRQLMTTTTSQQHPHLAYIQCGRRMFLASVMVASKFVQDKTYRNSAWATMAGLSVQEINVAERVFLELLGYRLYVAQATFDQWHTLLHTHVQAKSNTLLSTQPPQQQHHLYSSSSSSPSSSATVKPSTTTTSSSKSIPSSLLSTPALSPSSTASTSACSSPNVPSPSPHHNKRSLDSPPSQPNKKRSLDSPPSQPNKKRTLDLPSPTHRPNKRSLAHLLNSPQDPISRKRPCLSSIF